MKVDKNGHTITVKDTQGDLQAFVDKLTTEYHSFKDHNLIIDITAYNDLKLKNVLSFLALSNQHRAAKKSFVIAIKDFEFNDTPEEMIIVPTVLEANDIIEMEEIERDLGF
ncbi:ribonuclease Z [Flavobacterium sp. '19STA2R22 D10 B1']|uniref:ribonuclease Z n=1 Tax=Flavobacterium aerium TaxID=3037261 RepID=UPI00278C8AD7|nr:ribonuclease Z [Flavobacterium sp. '19STA2R22 D10 B1']